MDLPFNLEALLDSSIDFLVWLDCFSSVTPVIGVIEPGI